MPNSYAATNTKKFLDANGLAHFAQKLNQYPTNDVIEAVVEGIQDALDEKIDTSEKGTSNGVASLDSTGKVPSSQIPPYATMTGATSSADGSSGMVPAPTTADTEKFLRGDGTWGEGGKPMVVLSYGNSTWNDFLEAYNNNVIVYCKASSNSNPASGAQRRMAFMAYVDNHNVEFQYYRSVSSHTNAQQGDQTYVYKLTDTNAWSVTVRENYTKVVAGTGMSSTYNGGQITLAATNNGTITGITMNGESKGTSGDVNLGTVLTEHQDISGKLDASLKGVANGVADLDENGHVPSSQLPSYVDDVLEYNGRDSFPVTGEAGKIYVDISEAGGDKTYRWSGSTYTEISPTLALGTTSSTAFRGDHGNTAYTHAVTNKGSAFESGLYKITTNGEGHVTAASPVIKSDITALGIPGQDTTYVFDQVYDPVSNKAATVKTVSDAIETLSGGAIGDGATNKTLTSLSQSNGNVSATFDLISITKSQISDLETLGQAAVKDVDMTIGTESTSQNLPTSQAVAAFVEGKGYVTTDNNTTYSLVQNPNNGSDLTLVGSDGTTQQVLIPNTTYTFSDNSPTLNWNTRSAIGTVGGTELHVTLPANPNTDTSVTSASNHYTPVTDSESSLTANASGAAAAWGINVVQGLTLSTDGKGHVTNVSVQSGKVPTLGTEAGTAAEGNHVHPTTIATSISASQITLDASTKYQIEAGGTIYVFTTPPDTTYSAITDAEIDSIFA